MKVQVLLFADLAESAGSRTMALELSPGATVTDALETLVERVPAVASRLPVLAVAVGDRYVQRTMELHDGDELALIPPVSGG